MFLKQHIQVTLVSISFALEMQPILKQHLSKTPWSNLTLMGARKTVPQLLIFSNIDCPILSKTTCSV